MPRGRRSTFEACIAYLFAYLPRKPVHLLHACPHEGSTLLLAKNDIMLTYTVIREGPASSALPPWQHQFEMRILGWKELIFPKRIATVLTRFESADGFESAKGERLGVPSSSFYVNFSFFSLFFMLPFPLLRFNTF
jgi:hypothetical protein